MTVTANVNVKNYEIITVGEGTTYLETTSESPIFCKFTPNYTNTYKIYSSDSSGDPDVVVYDEDGQRITDDNTTGDFDVEVSMTKGKTYYIKYDEWSKAQVYHTTLNIEQR